MITRNQGRLAWWENPERLSNKRKEAKVKVRGRKLHTPQQTVPLLLSLPYHYFNQSYFIVFPQLSHFIHFYHLSDPMAYIIPYSNVCNPITTTPVTTLVHCLLSAFRHTNTSHPGHQSCWFLAEDSFLKMVLENKRFWLLTNVKKCGIYHFPLGQP